MSQTGTTTKNNPSGSVVKKTENDTEQLNSPEESDERKIGWFDVGKAALVAQNFDKESLKKFGLENAGWDKLDEMMENGKLETETRNGRIYITGVKK